MEQPKSHLDSTLLFFSKSLERICFYGFRSIIVLFMISDQLDLTNEAALSIYGSLALGLILSRIPGGIIGDLILNNRIAVYTGGILQILGSLTVCLFSSELSFYVGLILFVIGAGLHAPNFTAYFGKAYLNKIKLMDSGFALMYLAINIGAFTGSFLIGYLSEIYGFKSGFIVCSIIMLLSLTLFYFHRQKKLSSYSNEFNKVSFNLRFVLIFIITCVLGLYWLTYEIINFSIRDVADKFEKVIQSRLDLASIDIHSVTTHSFSFTILFATLLILTII
ncbi:MFS transporter [Salibacter halophilus]|uniref:Peptide MFS transporter n=1 Tax=Salibacter halophilus TaxID=1803916 RepID=A0A6N6M870_9FLAO|nr:MFS transporter [Salibacter halophilus]KAB1064437.1 peptide MFS transporter [Salibacter halophilus]